MTMFGNLANTMPLHINLLKEHARCYHAAAFLRMTNLTYTRIVIYLVYLAASDLLTQCICVGHGCTGNYRAIEPLKS